MHVLPLEDEFRRFAAAPADAVEGGLLVARVLDPATDAVWVRGELDRLAAGVGSAADAGVLVAALRGAGFGGAEDYYATANSSLEHVLRSRRGIPISLALVVLGVAERVGLAAAGINFPRHFLVTVEGALVDPFAMALLDMDEVEAALAGQDVPLAAALPPAGPVDIVLRMLNNLRLVAQQRGEHARALDLSGYQLLLAADPLPLHVERVDLWLAAGVPEMARRELEQAIAIAPGAALRERLARRRAEISAAPTRLH